MKKRIENKYKNLFTGFYIFVLLSGIYNLIIRLFGLPISIKELSYTEFTLNEYILGSIPIILFLLSIALVILIFIKKLPKYHLIYPIYYILFFVIWINLVTILILYYYGPYTIGLDILDRIQKYEVIFYFIDIIIPLYLLHKMYKK